ncbi:MAG: thrombospondin type 3 repeat-containing protein [Pseudomonadales bacterium]
MAPTLVFPLSSDKACFGLTEGTGPSSFEVGFDFNGEMGLRMGLKNEVSFEGGAASVSYAPEVSTRLEQDPNDPAIFTLIAELGEGAPTVSTTTPGINFALDAYTEFFGNAEVTFKYIDFDLETGLPVQAEEVIQLANLATSGDESGEIGPLGHGVDYTRLVSVDVGLGRAEVEYLEFPEVPTLLPLPEIQAEFETESQAPPNPEFSLTDNLEVDPFLGVLESIESTIGWKAFKTIRKPSVGSELACKFLNHQDKWTPSDTTAFFRLYGYDPYQAEELERELPPCLDFELMDFSLAAYNLSTPPTSLSADCLSPSGVKSCFNGFWRNTALIDSNLGIARQFLSTRRRTVDPFAPYNPFYSPPAQTTDFFRLGLDVDGLISTGLQQSMGQRLKRTNFEVSYDIADIDIATYFSWRKEVIFAPKLTVTYSFSEPVIINGETVTEHTVPVRTQEYIRAANRTCATADEDCQSAKESIEQVEGNLFEFNEVTFTHTGGDLSITKHFSVENNKLINSLILQVEPVIELAAMKASFGFNKQPFKALFKVLPSSVTGLQYTVSPNVKLPLLRNLGSTESLRNFEDQTSTEVLRVSVPELDVDTDADGFRDGLDNCTAVSNPDQNDLDQDGLGDVCDTDADGDSFLAISAGGNDPDDGDAFIVPDTDGDNLGDNQDNCPNIANPDQADFDQDGIGDACDSDFIDSDLDLIPDVIDNCLFEANNNQQDTDADGLGDVCDPSFGMPILVDFDVYPGGEPVPDRGDLTRFESVGLTISSDDDYQIRSGSDAFSAPNYLVTNRRATQVEFAFIDPATTQPESMARFEMIVLNERHGERYLFQFFAESGALLTESDVAVRREEIAGREALYVFTGAFHRVQVLSSSRGRMEFDSLLIHPLDTEAPLLNIPYTSISLALAPQAATLDVNFEDVTAFDLVDGEVGVTCAPTVGFPVGTHQVICYATDYAGNLAVETIEVTVVDVTAPELLLDAQPLTFELPDDAAVMQITLNLFATDAVDGLLNVTCDQPVLSIGSHAVACSVQDSSGNGAFANVPVRVIDVTAPVIALPATQEIFLDPDKAAQTLELTVMATDNVDGIIEAVCDSVTSGPGEVAITCEATDSSGNAAFATTLVSVIDNTAPTLLPNPGDGQLLLNLPVDSNVVQFDLSLVSAIDTVDGPVAVACTPMTLTRGAQQVVCSTADASGNIAEATYDVLVRDVTAPILTMPEAFTVDIPPENPTVLVDITQLVTVTDNAYEGLQATCDKPNLGPGVHDVTCEVTDGSNNTASGTVTVTVRDVTAPLLMIPPSQTIEFGTATGIELLGVATALDAVDGDLTPTFTDTIENPDVIINQVVQIIYRTWTVTDGGANERSGQQIIQLRDTTPPALTLPEDINVLLGEPNDPETLGLFAVAVDTYDASPTITHSDSIGPGATALDEVITRVWTATDRAGNAASAAQRITVSELDTLPLASINASTLSGNAPLNVSLAAQVTGGNLPLTYQWQIAEQTYEGANLNIDLEAGGTYSVVLTVIDKNGDQSIASTTIEAIVPIEDLLAEIETLKAARQNARLDHQNAKDAHKLSVATLRDQMRGERATDKTHREQVKLIIDDLRQTRRATKDAELKIQLSDQIDAQRNARQIESLASLERIQALQSDIAQLRSAWQVTRHQHVKLMLKINEDIAALRLEIRLRQPGSSAERDLIDQEIFDLQNQRRLNRELQSQTRLETNDLIALKQSELRASKLSERAARNQKSTEIRAVRSEHRKAKEATVRAALKAEIDQLKLDAQGIRALAKAEREAIKAEVSVLRANLKSTLANLKTANQDLRDQIKAYRQSR